MELCPCGLKENILSTAKLVQRLCSWGGGPGVSQKPDHAQEGQRPSPLLGAQDLPPKQAQRSLASWWGEEGRGQDVGLRATGTKPGVVQPQAAL